VPGIQFHGHFWPEGIVYAAVFAVTAWLVMFYSGWRLHFLPLPQFGIGLLLILPLRLLSSGSYRLSSWKSLLIWFPGHITIESFGSAVVGGLILMVANWVTMAPKKVDQ